MTSDRQSLVKKVRNKSVFPNSVELPHLLAKGLFFFVLIWGIAACQSPPSQEGKSAENKNVSRTDTQFILNNAILEQSNPQGNIVWKVKSATTVYSQDRQTANLEKVTANLLQEGKVILQLSSKKGKIEQNGAVIFLEEQIIVTDPRNRAIVRSEEAEWRPSEQILIVRRGVTGTNDNLAIEAQGGKYFIDTERLELAGNIIANTIEPSLRLKTDHLIWSIPQQQITSDRPLEIVRYQDEQITDRIVAEGGKVELQQNIATLHDNIEMRSLTPQLQIATNSAQWNYQTRIIKSDRPIQIIDLENQLNITGNQGKIDLNQEIANLDKGIKGINNRNQAKLYARELIWYIPTEKVEAVGDVIYQQANPYLNLTGDKAVGKLQGDSVVVTSNNQQNRVITEILP